MKIRSLNNATTLLKTDGFNFLLDPWLIGRLYNGAWSPFVEILDLEFLNNIDAVFISHIHEDHWDIKTMELLSREIKIYLPNMIVNRVIVNKLNEIGFKNIQSVDFGEVIKIGKIFEFSIIPPLNSFGQELENYIEGYESDATNIDTGLFVRDLKSETNHIFLFDNSPYDLSNLKSFIDIKLTTLWYPFNSYAQDYPLVYGFNKYEKERIHDEMHLKRMKAVHKCVDFLKPKYFLPHSADFLLNGKNSLNFNKYIKKEFMFRKNVSLNYSYRDNKNDFGISEYLDYGDELIVHSDSEIIFDRGKWKFNLNKSDLKTEEINSDLSDFYLKIKKSFELMNFRIKRFDLDIIEAKCWNLVLDTKVKKFVYSFEEEKIISESGNKNKKILTIYLTEKLLSALIHRNMHWNNAMIGCHLSVRRFPNEYCQAVYKALNFLHL